MYGTTISEPGTSCALLPTRYSLQGGHNTTFFTPMLLTLPSQTPLEQALQWITNSYIKQKITLCKWPLTSLSYDLPNQKSLKTLSRQLHTFRVEGNSKTFQDLHRNLTTFQGKMEFKDFSRTFLKIQGLFKAVWTLCRVREEIWQWPTLNVHVHFYYYCFLSSNVADVWQGPDL